MSLPTLAAAYGYGATRDHNDDDCKGGGEEEDDGRGNVIISEPAVPWIGGGVLKWWDEFEQNNSVQDGVGYAFMALMLLVSCIFVFRLNLLAGDGQSWIFLAFGSKDLVWFLGRFIPFVLALWGVAMVFFAMNELAAVLHSASGKKSMFGRMIGYANVGVALATIVLVVRHFPFHILPRVRVCV